MVSERGRILWRILGLRWPRTKTYCSWSSCHTTRSWFSRERWWEEVTVTSNRRRRDPSSSSSRRATRRLASRRMTRAHLLSNGGSNMRTSSSSLSSALSSPSLAASFLLPHTNGVRLVEFSSSLSLISMRRSPSMPKGAGCTSLLPAPLWPFHASLRHAPNARGSEGWYSAGREADGGSAASTQDDDAAAAASDCSHEPAAAAAGASLSSLR
mmetsp:Transcript_4858/g.11270  ORF Transcript_4858/g.11270 Transcript_4858/m.11270 type:complete len:212 (+) Transcript_4858:65-700(+)